MPRLKKTSFLSLLIVVVVSTSFVDALTPPPAPPCTDFYPPTVTLVEPLTSTITGAAGNFAWNVTHFGCGSPENATITFEMAAGTDTQIYYFEYSATGSWIVTVSDVSFAALSDGDWMNVTLAIAMSNFTVHVFEYAFTWDEDPPAQPDAGTFWDEWAYVVILALVVFICVVTILLVRKRSNGMSDDVTKRKCLSDQTSLWYAPACKKFRDEVERREREEMFRK